MPTGELWLVAEEAVLGPVEEILERVAEALCALGRPGGEELGHQRVLLRGRRQRDHQLRQAPKERLQGNLGTHAERVTERRRGKASLEPPTGTKSKVPGCTICLLISAFKIFVK